MSKPSDFDWVGHWFTLLNETGEASEIFFGRVPAAGEGAEIVRLPHSRYDGITGLIDLLRQRGHLSDADLPRLPKRPRPSLWVLIREVLKGISRPPLKPRQWRDRDPLWATGKSSPETTAFSWAVFTQEETRLILQNSKAAQVSMNSYLLKHLADAVEPYLDSSSRPAVWLMPVALHPSVTTGLEPRNLSSFIDVFLGSGAKLPEVAAAVKRVQEAQAFWGNWLILNLGAWLGEGVVRWIVRTNPKTQKKTGVFSNLGVWGESSGDAWFFAPPVVEFQPMSAGALTFGGRLSLSVRIHPAVSRGASFSQGILDSWKLRLLAS